MRTPRSAIGAVTLALLGAVLSFAAGPVEPASAKEDTPEGYASFVFKQYAAGGGGNLPECGPININGRTKTGFARWSVGSSVADGAEIEVGDVITLTATVYSFFGGGSAPNDGPDPLVLDLQVDGPAAQAAIPKGSLNTTPYNGDGSVGPIGPVGAFGYQFDSNSSPKGAFQPGDGTEVKLVAKIRANAPGKITVPELKVSGYDATPKASSFDCSLPLGLDFTVDDVDPPTSGADVVSTDATYSANTVDDANGGSHAIDINVLANDDDPEVAGGPGDPAQVRIKDWQPNSVKGGTVKCGTPAQKGTAAFASMSAGPCVYSPPANAVGTDQFTYILSSVSGLQRAVKVDITLKPNLLLVAVPAQFAANDAAVNQQFDLGPTIADAAGDNATCFPELPTVSNNAGTVLIASDCTFSFTANNTPAQRTGTFTYRTCDVHPLLTPGSHGALATPRPGYDQGSPDDLSATTSSRCINAQASVLVTPVNDTFVAPVVGVPDVDVVDAGYSSDGIGAYHLEIPVFANDLDPNGPDPADPASGVRIPAINGIQGVDASAGTATRLDERTVGFTPTDGFEGLTSFNYVACEDPAQQTPTYQGLPVCGLGTVAVLVLGNDAPVATDDEVLTSSLTPISDLDVSANDQDPDGEPLSCTAGPLSADPDGLVASASIDADCLVTLTPVADADGVATLAYEVCDSHALANPQFAADPYGDDGRSPNDLVSRCTQGELRATIVAPAPNDPSDFDLDPAPVCIADAASVDNGGSIQLEVLANDTDLDPEGQPGLLTVTGVGVDGEEGVTEAGGTVEVTNVGESIRYNAPAKFEGTDRFLYSAQDAQGKGCSAEVTVTVAGVVVSPEPNNPGPPENPENPGNPGNSSGPDQPGSPSGPSSPEQPESGPESIVDPPTSTPPGAGNRNTPGGAPGPAAAAVATPTPGSAAVVVPAAAVLRSTGSSVSSPSGTLPRTGSGVGGLTAMAMAAVVAGLALVMVSRRRNRRTR